MATLNWLRVVCEYGPWRRHTEGMQEGRSSELPRLVPVTSASLERSRTCHTRVWERPSRCYEARASFDHKAGGAQDCCRANIVQPPASSSCLHCLAVPFCTGPDLLVSARATNIGVCSAHTTR